MTGEYPKPTSTEFPEPPREIVDAEGREIELQEATASEIDSLVEMYFDFDPEDRAQGIPPASEDDIREWLNLLFGEDGINVIARHDGDAVGHVTLVADRTGDYELAIFVLQPYQGAHIGTELVLTALGVAKREGVDRIWLTVERWNRPAIRLYEKAGFEMVDNESFELEMELQL